MATSDLCCPDHSTFGTFSCDTTRHAACCEYCPDWFPVCFWCQKVHAEGYRRCFECQHVFGSKRELRQGHRKFFRKEMQDKSLPLIFSSAQWGPSRLLALWRFLTLRANGFGFCPLCTHDF